MAENGTASAMVPNHPRTVSYWRLMTDQQVITQEVRNHEYAGSGTENDPYVVSWLPDDPRNPMQFAMARKVVIVLVTGFSALIISLASSGYSGSIRGVIQYFDISEEVATLGLSLYVIGFSVGPLIWAPLSENVGRQIPFFISFLLLAAFCAGCAAAQNIQTLLVLRFFAGAFGSSPLTNAGGVVSDMFTSRQRGLALCLFASTPYIGNPPRPSRSFFFHTNNMARPGSRSTNRWISRNERGLAMGGRAFCRMLRPGMDLGGLHCSRNVRTSPPPETGGKALQNNRRMLPE